METEGSLICKRRTSAELSPIRADLSFVPFCPQSLLSELPGVKNCSPQHRRSRFPSSCLRLSFDFSFPLSSPSFTWSATSSESPFDEIRFVCTRFERNFSCALISNLLGSRISLQPLFPRRRDRVSPSERTLFLEIHRNDELRCRNQRED